MKTCCMCLVGMVTVAAACAEPAVKFASVGSAVSAFSTNSVAVREEAYRYVVERARSAGEMDLRQALGALRTMSVSLGRTEDYDSACEAGLTRFLPLLSRTFALMRSDSGR